MTQEEDFALSLFIKMVAELNSGQEMIDTLRLEATNELHKQLVEALCSWMDTMRCGYSQEMLNETAMKLVEQQEY